MLKKQRQSRKKIPPPASISEEDIHWALSHNAKEKEKHGNDAPLLIIPIRTAVAMRQSHMRTLLENCLIELPKQQMLLT